MTSIEIIYTPLTLQQVPWNNIQILAKHDIW